MLTGYFFVCLLTTMVLSGPIDERGIDNQNRVARSPTLKKKGPLALLLGLNGGGTTGANHGGQGVNNYININNYGSHPQIDHHPHQTVDYGNGHGGSYAGSAAVAGSHGGGQSQSQSASFSFGPYSGSFSQSQSQSGRGGGYNDFINY